MTTPSDFITYLNGFVDALNGATPTPAQWAQINAKLDSCFDKVTPDRSRTVRATTCQDDPNSRAVTNEWTGVLRGAGDMDKVTFHSVDITC